MIITDFQPLAFYDCTYEKCNNCGVERCDKYALYEDYFSFQFNNTQSWDSGAGNYPVIDVVDADGTVISTIDNGLYYINEDIVQVVGLWDDYVAADGCYKFILRDINVVINGGFTSNINNWTDSGADWSWSAGKAIIGSGVYTTSILSQSFSNPVCLQGDAMFSFTIAGAFTAFYVYLNDLLFATITGSGDQFVMIPEGTEIKKIGFSFDNNSMMLGSALDNVSLVLDYETAVTCVYTEMPFCTTYIEAWNNINMTNFDFESDTTRQFKFFMRLKSEIVNPRYPTEEEIYLSSAGNNTLHYARSEKVWNFNIARITEMTWDALTTIFMCYYLYFDGDRFIKLPGDLEPQWQKSNKYMASGTVQVKKQTENRKK